MEPLCGTQVHCAVQYEIKSLPLSRVSSYDITNRALGCSSRSQELVTKPRESKRWNSREVTQSPPGLQRCWYQLSVEPRGGELRGQICAFFLPERRGVIKNCVDAGRGVFQKTFAKNFTGEEIPHSLQTWSSLLHDQGLRLDPEFLIAVLGRVCLRGWAAGWRRVPG